MLKHGRIYPRKKGWTMRYLRWLQEQQFGHPAHQIALQEMLEAVRVSKERVERLGAAIEEFIPKWSLAPVVRALQALRGVSTVRKIRINNPLERIMKGIFKLGGRQAALYRRHRVVRQVLHEHETALPAASQIDHALSFTASGVFTGCIR